MKFGVSLGAPPYTKSLSLLRAAERAGFDQIWIWDSHIIWQEVYSLMGWLIGMSNNDRLEWGTCVTNPVTRDPMVVGSAFATLNQITGGRVICGIGRGDSSVRVINRRPSNLAALERAVEIVRSVGRGRNSRRKKEPRRRCHGPAAEPACTSRATARRRCAWRAVSPMG